MATDATKHARLVVGDATERARLVVGLANPDARLTDIYQRYLKSPPRKATDHDFHAWCLIQIKSLSGADSFGDAYKNPDVRTLLAFGYMGYLQHADALSSPVSRAMPVPKEASDLEADFFPALLEEIRARARSDAAFAQHLGASEERMSDLVTRLSEASSTTANSAAPPGTAAAQAGIGDTLNLLAFVGLMIWAGLAGEKKKST